MAFGIEVYGPSGNTLLSMSSRVPRFVQNGTFTLNSAANTTVNVPNMQNNDSWDVFLAANASASVDLRLALNTGFFSVRNASAENTLVAYWVVRS